jgi:HEAT repeat protein
MRAFSLLVPLLLNLADSSDGGPGRPAPATRTGDLELTLGVLREAQASRDYETRLFAVQALGAVHAVDVTRWLEHALGDPEHDVRVAAVESLRRLGTPRAATLLRSVRDDKQEVLQIRALAASALLSSETP